MKRSAVQLLYVHRGIGGLLPVFWLVLCIMASHPQNVTFALPAVSPHPLLTVSRKLTQSGMETVLPVAKVLLGTSGTKRIYTFGGDKKKSL